MLPKYKRILLKLSGESLMGNKNFGLDSGVIAAYAQDIKSVIELGVQVAIVMRGRNHPVLLRADFYHFGHLGRRGGAGRVEFQLPAKEMP